MENCSCYIAASVTSTKAQYHGTIDVKLFDFLLRTVADGIDADTAADFVEMFSELLLAMEIGEGSLSFLGLDFLFAILLLLRHWHQSSIY